MKNKNHTSHCTLYTSQKGITLIALIITIIVMLILVGVTVNVALNGGVFSKAKQAATEMEKQTIYEQIIASMKLENSGKIDVAETYNAANAVLTAQGKTVTTKTNTDTQIVLEVEGKNGTYTYTITENKIVIGETDDSDGLKISHQIIDGTKIALKVESGIDIDETLIQYIEANFGPITLDESGWIAIAKKLGGSNITTKEEALEHINVNYFKLPQTQSEEDTKASLVMAAADIKVNGVPYNMLTSGYLIDIGENDTSTIEVVFEDLSTTVEIGEEKEKYEKLTYNKTYKGSIDYAGMPVDLYYCFLEKPQIAMMAMSLEGELPTNAIIAPHHYSINTQNDTFIIDGLDDQAHLGVGIINEDSIEIVFDEATDLKVVCTRDNTSLFDLYSPQTTDITDTDSLYYGFKNGIYNAGDLYVALEMYTTRMRIQVSYDNDTNEIYMNSGFSEDRVTETLSDYGISVSQDGKVWHTNTDGEKIELTLIQDF